MLKCVNQFSLCTLLALERCEHTFSHVSYHFPAIIVFIKTNLLFSYNQGLDQGRLAPSHFSQPQLFVYQCIDNIIVCYRERTNGTRTCGHYFVLLLLVSQLFWLLIETCCPRHVCTFDIGLVAVVQPYKPNVYNTMDPLNVFVLFWNIFLFYCLYVDTLFQSTIFCFLDIWQRSKCIETCL